MFHRFMMHLWLAVYDFADRWNIERIMLHAINKAGLHCHWNEAVEAARLESNREDWDL